MRHVCHVLQVVCAVKIMGNVSCFRVLSVDFWKHWHFSAQLIQSNYANCNIQCHGCQFVILSLALREIFPSVLQHHSLISADNAVMNNKDKQGFATGRIYWMQSSTGPQLYMATQSGSRALGSNSAQTTQQFAGPKLCRLNAARSAATGTRSTSRMTWPEGDL